MATKEISQLPSTNLSNDTDLLMTRQGAQDRAVAVEKLRNVGTEAGQSLGVGGYGIGGEAVEITSLFASNNADIINRNGVYRISGTTNVPVATGELKHWQVSNNEATQEVIGSNQEAYFRKKVAGTWLAWVLYGAANKQTVRTDLSVPSNAEALLVANRLQEIANAGAAAQLTAAGNINVYGKGQTVKTLSVFVNSTGSPFNVIKEDGVSLNVSSITKVSTGIYQVNFNQSINDQTLYHIQVSASVRIGTWSIADADTIQVSVNTGSGAPEDRDFCLQLSFR